MGRKKAAAAGGRKRLDRFDEELTERVIEAIEAGTAPWQRPWTAAECADLVPRNAATGRAYHGGNVLWLIFAGWPDPRWLGFSQALKLGGSVRKGEKGTPILVMSGPPKNAERDDEDAAERKAPRRPWLGVRTVFNVLQCDGLEIPEAPARLEAAAEPGSVGLRIAEGMGVRVVAGGEQPCYVPERDTVLMPPRAAFESDAAYEHVLMHELAHATGHVSRLDRPGDDKPTEELTVEMAALLTGVSLGIGHDPLRSASYAESWTQGLRDRAGAVRAAGTEAARIADYLAGHARAQEAA